MESFVNLSVLECNRANSEEAKTGNNENFALWHNKIGTGVVINPGDKIQVEQSFINEIGAGDQIIEFLGTSLNAQKKITYLSVSQKNASEFIPQGYEQISYTEETETIDLVDNKVSTVINYYKAMNGENYIQMPRKFTCYDPVVNNASIDIRRQIWNAQENSSNLGSNVAPYGSMGGLPFHQVPYFKRDSRIFYYCDDDYYYFANNIQDHFNGSNKGQEDFFKLRNDGSKYTIFARKDSYFNSIPGYGQITDVQAIEDFAIATGSSSIVMGGFNSNLFLNGVTGITTPGQIGGGALVQDAGGGQGTYDGFDSTLEPFPTPRYFAFTGSNTRYLRTKDITGLIQLGGEITIVWIKGNSSNGGETADLNENLELKILNAANVPISTTVIALGGGTPYPNNIFTETTYTLTASDIATGARIEITQTSSSQANFDVYGLKYLALDSVSASNRINLQNVVGSFTTDQYLKIDGVMTDLMVLSWNSASNILLTKSSAVEYRIDGKWVEAYWTKDTIYAPSWPKSVSSPEYLEYTERLDLEVPKGRNSPSNVAASISRQLRQTGSFNQIYYNRSLNSPNFTPQRAISGYIESETYKIFNAANILDMINTNFDEFNKDPSASNIYGTPAVQPNEAALTWMNALQFIGIKRPDLYIAGKTVQDLELAVTTVPIINGVLNTTDNSGYGSDFIPTNIRWTNSNLLKLKNLFDIQGNYPELFKAPYNDYGTGAQHWSASGARGIISVTTNRFLHINPYRSDTTGTEINELGSDDISASGGSSNDELSNFISLPLYFYWDSSKAETLTNGQDINDLAYGFAYKQRISTGQDVIYFYVGGIGGWQPPLEYFKYNGSAGAHDGPPPSPENTTIAQGTRIGWDEHWTAFSTCVIGLCDGYVDYPYIQSASFTATNIQPDYENQWINGINSVWDSVAGIAASPASYMSQIKKIYLGANEPTLAFDDTTGRFNINQLHTPEFIGNDVRAGSTPSASNAETIPIDPNADNKVYKINKRITNTNFTTAMIPYSCNFVQSASNSSLTKYDLSLMNVNLDQYKIFDTKSGITIKDFGIGEKEWPVSLWGILGFSYNQFNTKVSASNTYNTQITEQNMKQLAFATTNADITSGQSIQYITNEWGVPLFNQQVPAACIWYGKNFNTPTTQLSRGTRAELLIQNFPPITEEQTSIELVAQNLPKKMIQPYFCIRSDLIAMAHYLGGEDSGQILPVCGIINKINGYGDYYFSNDSPLVFTVTQRKIITSVTTSIHYANQKFANVDSDSAIIYKIERFQPAESNILEQILSSTDPKNKPKVSN